MQRQKHHGLHRVVYNVSLSHKWNGQPRYSPMVIEVSSNNITDMIIKEANHKPFFFLGILSLEGEKRGGCKTLNQCFETIVNWIKMKIGSHNNIISIIWDGSTSQTVGSKSIRLSCYNILMKHTWIKNHIWRNINIFTNENDANTFTNEIYVNSKKHFVSNWCNHSNACYGEKFLWLGVYNDRQRNHINQSLPNMKEK